jgi:hypothetical protein
MRLSAISPLAVLSSFAVGQDQTNPQNMTTCLVSVPNVVKHTEKGLQKS